jgi:flagellar basal-body rod protein FlgF
LDPLLISAASGMKSRMQSLDLLANNVANSGTAGFKSDQEFSGLFDEHLPVNDNKWTDFSQGSLTTTGNPLNLALSGKGFFAMNAPTGIVYTRNGDLKISKTNELETADGNTPRNVLDNGKPIVVDPSQLIDIDKTGVVTQGGQTVGQMEVDSPNAPVDLSKLGNSYFIMADKNTAVPPAQNTDVLQGQIEQSNTPVVENAVKLVSVMRQFEMLQKAISLGSEMNKLATDEVAKVS